MDTCITVCTGPKSIRFLYRIGVSRLYPRMIAFLINAEGFKSNYTAYYKISLKNYKMSKGHGKNGQRCLIHSSVLPLT